MDLNELIDAAQRIAHGIPGNSPAHNLVKLTEETGELARTWTRQLPREAIIEEACDVIITALVAAAFADVTVDELASTLRNKCDKSLARCSTGASASPGSAN